jgi:ribonucleoside-triphosphate reductase
VDLDFHKPSVWKDINLGATVDFLDKLHLYGCDDNANMDDNPEMKHKYTADEATKKFALMRILDPVEQAFHVRGYGHVHDLEFFVFRPMNCLQHDLTFFIRNGLKVDGTGLHTSMAKPAKNLFTLVNHIGQILGAGQVNMSGGQSIPFINTFLAPYVHGMTLKELKQAVQMLIFNTNMSYVSRGGQAVFSSFNIDLEMPEFLKETPVVFGGDQRILDGAYLYGDWQEEAKQVAHMIIEVLHE